MAISVSTQTEQRIEDRVRRGGYATADDLIRAGLDSLDQQESLGQFDPGEMEALLSAGERSGVSLDGEQVLSELRALRNHRPSKAG